MNLNATLPAPGDTRALMQEQRQCGWERFHCKHWGEGRCSKALPKSSDENPVWGWCSGKSSQPFPGAAAESFKLSLKLGCSAQTVLKHRGAAGAWLLSSRKAAAHRDDHYKMNAPTAEKPGSHSPTPVQGQSSLAGFPAPAELSKFTCVSSNVICAFIQELISPKLSWDADWQQRRTKRVSVPKKKCWGSALANC